ncbi:hypothetical protein BJ508DRAFT_336078 [Ascobolus immersus RN42]|uniref:Uncharacterized protein n=1 Tax=Ascobolus immersus RN42 TaxID=1160509 RepID=A0A3N4HG76_ASCIM|nr:hypothetical protein BJ508DRAFT_336078 [Ascobolus immersus RN42]
MPSAHITSTSITVYTFDIENPRVYKRVQTRKMPPELGRSGSTRSNPPTETDHSLHPSRRPAVTKPEPNSQLFKAQKHIPGNNEYQQTLSEAQQVARKISDFLQQHRQPNKLTEHPMTPTRPISSAAASAPIPSPEDGDTIKPRRRKKRTRSRKSKAIAELEQGDIPGHHTTVGKVKDVAVTSHQGVVLQHFTQSVTGLLGVTILNWASELPF